MTRRDGRRPLITPRRCGVCRLPAAISSPTTCDTQRYFVPRPPRPRQPCSPAVAYRTLSRNLPKTRAFLGVDSPTLSVTLTPRARVELDCVPSPGGSCQESRTLDAQLKGESTLSGAYQDRFPSCMPPSWAPIPVPLSNPPSGSTVTSVRGVADGRFDEFISLDRPRFARASHRFCLFSKSNRSSKRPSHSSRYAL